MSARGNMTSFLLPWQDLLKKLEAASDGVPGLPRTGEDLCDIVSVVLKTNEEASPDSMARFVHQANVRRRIVVKLIYDAKARGQRGYRNADMAAVEQKASRLPENGIPPEIVKLLPHDKDLDKVMVQKAACPVAGRCEVEEAAASMDRMKPNAVVLKRGQRRRRHKCSTHPSLDTLRHAAAHTGQRNEASIFKTGKARQCTETGRYYWLGSGGPISALVLRSRVCVSLQILHRYARHARLCREEEIPPLRGGTTH